MLHAPLIDLVVMSEGPPRPIRATAHPLRQPYAVIAGAPHTGKSSLVDTLLAGGRAPEGHRPGTHAPAVPRLRRETPGWAPVDGAAWLVFRSGAHLGARAFVPGHREPRPIGLDSLRGETTAGLGGPSGLLPRANALAKDAPTAQRQRREESRPPRRIEITHPAPLLEHIALVDTPGIADHDDATADIVLDATDRAAGLVYVLAAGEPLRDAQLAFLAGVTTRVVFALTRIDERPDWIDVVSANRARLERDVPALARASWFPVAVGPGGLDGVAELREALAVWGELHVAIDVRPGPAGADPGRNVVADPGDAGFDLPSGVRRSPMSAVTVSTGDGRWEAVLDRAVRGRRVAAIQRASIDLATIHVRCVQELASGDGCPELPYVLDRALHALSVRVSRLLVTDTDAVIETVFGGLLDEPPGPDVQRRIRLAARRTVDTLVDEDRVRERALLLTTTSAVAVLVGPAAVGSLSATGLPEPDDRVLPAIGLGLTASCYQLWRTPREAPTPRESTRGTDKKDCRRWLQQALRVVEAEIERELGGRYDDLRQSLAIIAADAVDHGVLLA